MNRVVVSAAAVVFGITLFAGIGNSDASASEHGRIRSRNDLRTTWSPGFKVTKITSRNDLRCKSSNKAIAGRGGVSEATGR